MGLCDNRRLRSRLIALGLGITTGLAEFVTDPDVLPWPIRASPFLLIAGRSLVARTPTGSLSRAISPNKPLSEKRSGCTGCD